MLLGKHEQLADLILRQFETEPSQTAKALYSNMLKERKCSLVAVYKELNKLIDLGIVVKSQDRYTVSLPWVLELVRYAESLYDSYLGTNAIDSFLPKAGSKLKWRFNNLIRMDRFWAQLIFTLFETSESRDMYEWVPHLWFPLVDLKRDLHYLRAMKIAKNRIFLIVGGDTFLDHLSTENWDEEIYQVSFAESPFWRERECYYCLIDNFIITVRVTKKVANEIDRFFNSIRSHNELDFQAVYQFFNQTIPADITLENNRKKAKVLKKRFVEFWGH